MLWVLNHPTPKQRNDLHVIIRDDFEYKSNIIIIANSLYLYVAIHIKTQWYTYFKVQGLQLKILQSEIM